jgi:hypothetical protein
MGLVGPSSTGAYADFCYRLAVRFLTSHGGPEDLALARSRYTLTAAEHGLTFPGALEIRQAAFRAAGTALGVPWILNAPPFWRSAEEIEAARRRDLNDWTTPVAA